jgi:hypothetical protein
MREARPAVRLLVALIAVVLAGILAEAARATGQPAQPALDDPTLSDATGDASSEGTVESPPAEVSETPPAETVEPVPVETPPTETPPTDTVEPPPAETPPADTVEPPPAEAPPTDTVEPPPAEPAPSETVEPPLVEMPAPSPALSKDAPSTGDRRQPAGAGTAVSANTPSDIPDLFDASGRSVLLRVGGDDGASGGAQTPTREDPSSRPSKAGDPLLDVSAPQPSPASSPPSAGAAPPSAGSSYSIAADFIGPSLLMLSCAFALSLTLPHGAAYALRSERPG